MNFLGDFHFIRPAWLLLVPVVVGLWWLARQSQDSLRGWRAVMDPRLLEALTIGESATNRWRGLGLLARLVVGRCCRVGADVAAGAVSVSPMTRCL